MLRPKHESWSLLKPNFVEAKSDKVILNHIFEKVFKNSFFLRKKKRKKKISKKNSKKKKRRKFLEKKTKF